MCVASDGTCVMGSGRMLARDVVRFHGLLHLGDRNGFAVCPITLCIWDDRARIS